MQSETITPTPTKSGLATLWDVIVAPGSAFAVLRERPYAGWAFLITVVLGIGGAILQAPATEHITNAVLAAKIAHDPQLASMTPEQQARMTGFNNLIAHWGFVAVPLVIGVAVSVSALIMLLASVASGGDGNFRRAFALAANVGVINLGIGYVLYGVLVAIRGGDAFNTNFDLFSSMPTLALLAPGAGGKIGTALSTVNPFQLWSFALLGLGQRKVMNTNAVVAWVAALLVILIPAALAASSAQ